MKIALVGSSGYIAGFLMERFRLEKGIESILTIDQQNTADAYLNLLNPEAFDYDCLLDIDYVVFTAAISSPDKCADDFDLCYAINVKGTRFFIREAIKRKCKVIFFSSDAVFGDIPGEIYTELSETNSATPYGRMKKNIEDEFWDDMYFKAIRLSYVASCKDKFITYCLKCIQTGEIADVFHPFYRNVVVVKDVVDVVLWLINQWDNFNPTVLNVAGKELVSRVRLADELNRMFDNKLKYTISTPDNGFYKNRPPITQMKSLYIQQYGILKDETITEKLQKELNK